MDLNDEGAYEQYGMFTKGMGINTLSRNRFVIAAKDNIEDQFDVLIEMGLIELIGTSLILRKSIINLEIELREALENK